jgi:ribonuclease D
MERETPPLIDTQAGLERLLPRLQAEAVAVDAEMDSFYSYREKVCLLQFSTEGGDYLVDTLAGLDLSVLAGFFRDPRVIKVFHAGENDIPYLRHFFGFEVEGLFDTYLAARVLGYPRCSLAALLEQHFGVKLEKKYQMADWRLRPLPEGQARYARLDTRYLLQLSQILEGELVRAGRLEEARAEFARACRSEYVPRVFDPEGWARLPSVRELTGQGRAILRELYHWREGEARRRDVALFRVVGDRALVDLARRPPQSLQELQSRPGVGGYARRLMEVLNRASSLPPIPLPRPGRPGGQPLPPDQEQAYQRLRHWRNQRAQERGVEADRVASNRLLRRLVEAAPRDLEALAAVPGMEPWRAREYGAEMLAVLQGS